jgi:predicted ATPase
LASSRLYPEVGTTEAQNRFHRSLGSLYGYFVQSHIPYDLLDDLQWIDSATIKLIELMLLDEQTQFLFLIGAYRDNEVNPTHPLVLTLERLRKQGAFIQPDYLGTLNAGAFESTDCPDAASGM